ncbi:MAG TPA: hypothetical protein DIW47_04210 [Bacteroidetes bacterium]|nr:hypothetical protein [Bacteroidota bacterium]
MNLKCFFIVLFGLVFSQLSAQTEPDLLYLKVNAGKLSIEQAVDSLEDWRFKGLIKAFSPVFTIKNDSLNQYYSLELISEEYKGAIFSKAKQKEWIEFVEEVPVHQLQHLPNDLDNKQWHLRKVWSEFAWEESLGDPVIVIAVVDDAVRTDHEDLAPVIWTNTGEIPNNGIDDDGNGYVDDVNGWDAADNDNDPNPPLSKVNSTTFTHGTHCAGIVGAKSNNGKGIASLGYNIRIMPVKVARSGSDGKSLSNAIQGVEYAMYSGARVISMSWGSYIPSRTEQAVFELAYQMGIVCIAAAGNNDVDAPLYPANYNYVISVGATDSMDLKASFSNFGAGTDIMAPGVDIWSSLATGTNAYGYMSGTSMACPLVASLAGLMLSKDTLLTPDQVEACIKATADNIDGLNPSYPGNLGAGRINAEKAMKCVKAVYANFDADMYHVCPGGSVQFYDNSLRWPNTWSWEFQGGNPSTSTVQNPVVSYATTGSYKVKLKVSNSKGTDSVEINNYITVALPTATLSGTYTIPAGYSANLLLNLTGTAPWRVKLTNGQFSFWIDNIQSPTYYFPVTPQNTSTFTIDSIYDANCKGTSSGSAVITISSFNSGNCQNATNTFQKRFKASGTDEMHAIIPCFDGGFMMIGTTTSIGAGNKDIFAIRTDDTGKVLWAQSYGSTGVEMGYSVKVVQTTDSGFAITGNTTGFSAQAEDIYFLKLSKSGVLQKQKKLGGGGTEYGRAVFQTLDGGYLVGGTSGSSPKSGAQDAYVIKLDTAGNMVWNKKYGFAGLSTNHFISFQGLPSGNVWLIGHGDHFVTPYVGYLVKVSPSGALLAERRIYTNQFDAPIAATQLKDGKIALIGLNSSNNGTTYTMQVMVMDTTGSILWAKNLSNGGNIRSTGGVGTSDSGLVVIGYATGFGNAEEIFTVKFTNSGAILWSKKFGSPGSEKQDAWSQCITESPDKGLVFGLHTTGFNSSGTDLMMIKANECGFTGGCYDGNVTFTVTNLNMTVTSPTAYQNTGVSVSTVNTAVQNWTGIIDTSNFCPNSGPAIPGCAIVADFTSNLSCTGEKSRFTSTSTSAGKTVVYYKWFFGNGDSVEGFSTPQYTYTNSGTYTVKLIVGDNGSPACFDTISKQIEIFDDLTVRIAGEDTVCSADTFALGLESLVCASGKVRYRWSPQGIFNDSSLQNPKAALLNSSWIHILVIDSVGNQARDSLFIFVDGNCCRSYASWSSPLPVVCPGDSIEFENRSVAKTGASYVWNFGSNASPTQFNGQNPPKVFFSPSGSYDVSLVIQDFCGTDTFEHQVFVLPPPDPGILNDTIICQQDSLQFTLDYISSFLYDWSPGYRFSDSTISNPKAWIDGDTKLYLYVLDYWSGCASLDSIRARVEDIDTMKYNLDTTLCFPNSVILDYPGTGISAVWKDGGIGIPRIVTVSGTYIVDIMRNYCTTTDTHTVNLINPNLQIFGPDLLCKDDSGTYYINKVFSSMSWSNGSTDSFTFHKISGPLRVTVVEGSCVIQDSIEIEVFDIAPLVLGDSVFCQNDSTQLTVNYPNASISWSNGDTGSQIWANTPGYYIVTVERGGCKLSDSLELTRINIPFVNFPEDTFLCVGEFFSLNGGSWPLSTYMWNDASNDSFKLISNTGVYKLTVQNVCGIDADSISLVFQDCECISYIPNAFTPNGDGLNDYFGPTFCDIEDFHMIIFDRWGEIIFETDDMNKLWDGIYRGVPVPEGVFGYLIHFRDVRNKNVNTKGNVTVLYPKN